MTVHTNPRRFDRARRASGAGVLLLGAFSALGLVMGVLSQVNPFGGYEEHVEAAAYRPIIVPCLVALVAAVVGSVVWYLAFVRDWIPRFVIVPCLVVAAGGLVVAFSVAGPSEVRLERRWSERLSTLRLPAEFRPAGARAGDSSGRYVVSRQWVTDLAPAQGCPALRAAVEEWLGQAVMDSNVEGCYLYASDGKDAISASFGYRGADTPGPEMVGVRIALVV